MRVCVNRMLGDPRPAHPRHTANPIVGAVREPPTTLAVMRREGVADNVLGGLLIIVGGDSVGVSARDYDGGWWKASFIGWVRRGGTGRGRFTNRPYGVYGRAERRVCVCDERDVVICASVSIGRRMTNGQRTRGTRRTVS